ncbi:uncharacterized protein LOC111546248 [Piliocolobus tephrosceles]|uniref:uncharacterized protein LOC111546248 n=1 Tax=Piliocolobus tephrosceles TaxID=591936 RepID=UPI000E6AFFB6|nr:uncharacterized protein LOC111546248 [Piliocolobus tephrosceles]
MQKQGRSWFPGQGGAPCHHCGDQEPLHQDPSQWYPAHQSLHLDPKAAHGRHGHTLLPGPGGPDQLSDSLPNRVHRVLFIYLLFYFPEPCICGHKYDFTSSWHTVVHLPCICHSFHYVKLLLETLLVRHFSHGTMPLPNIFKNCTYYRGFNTCMAYYINHLPPTYGAQQVKLALSIFVICLCLAASPSTWPCGTCGPLGPRPGRSCTSPRSLSRGSSCWCPAPTTPLGGVLDQFCHHDAVSPSGPVLPGELHPDNYLCQGQAPPLPEGVPGLSAPAHAHHPLPALSAHTCGGSAPHQAAFWRGRGAHSSPASRIKPACPSQKNATTTKIDKVTSNLQLRGIGLLKMWVAGSDYCLSGETGYCLWLRILIEGLIGK